LTGGGALGAAARSVARDLVGGWRFFVVNGLAGHALVPRAVRWLIYRTMGLDIATRGVSDSCRLIGPAIRIGPRTYLNREVLLQSRASAAVAIGADCHLAMRVTVTTSTHEAGDHDLVVHRPVSIGDRVWLGVGVIVLPGVTIADDVTVGAGAVVTTDCREPGVYVGVPAVRVR
jgi:acetyltransferase-like isoleucine patch superfamily enzyme